MKFKANKHWLITIVLIILPLLVFLWIKQSGHFDAFYAWSQRNIILFVVVLFLLKVVAFIYPPLPGGILTLGSIPIIGWVPAYLVDLSGSTVGSAISYLIGRKFGFRFLGKILDDQTVERIKRIKIKKHKELETVFMFRILGGTVVEFVAYACGILQVGYGSFLLGSVASHMVVGIPTFYLADTILTTRNLIVSGILSVALLYLLYRFKDRYLEL